MKPFVALSCNPAVLALCALCALAGCALAGCARSPEMSLADIEALLAAGKGGPIEGTVYKPWRGEEFAPGTPGGVWNASVAADPKSFNLLVAERDGATKAVMDAFTEYLLDYDYVRKEFVPNCASAEIIVNEAAGTLSVLYTLRDDLWWTAADGSEPVKVTSDDVVFWYNEIEGDPEFKSSLYNAQFVTMPDGSQERVQVRRLDDLRFVFDFPRIDANPLLSSNRSFGPRYIYEKAKKEGGVQGVLDLFSVASDPRSIPSMGMWLMTEYSPGQRMVFIRNSRYWKKDANGSAPPYPERRVVQIIPDENTRFLLFKQGQQETYRLRPEDLEELTANAQEDYTVFAADGALGATFWSFNQNPKNKDSPFYEWFTKKEFRQAMSCLVNRDRLIAQTFRGLAEPKLTLFAEANPFYNPEITLQYRYDVARAEELLASIGMKRDDKGVMRDEKGRAVEFDLTISADTAQLNDAASILADDLSRVGIRLRIRATDFQKVVEQLTASWDWQSVIIGLGSNYWPTQGVNVWPSTGNLHLWYPLQESPATEWEARIDYLYNEGSYTLDEQKSWEIWNEYQAIILEQCPLIYLVRPRSFMAVRNRWDFTNVYFDNIGDLQIDHAFLRQ